MSGFEPVTIVGCSEADLPELARILAESPEASRWSDRALSESFRNSNDRFLVARAGGEVVGFILGRSGGEEAEILNLAVKGEWRRRGMGRALAGALLEFYAQEGTRRIFLEVRESNRGAIAFYQGMGFSEVGKRPDYYRDPGEAALVLARETCREG